MAKKKKMLNISVCMEPWLDDLLTIRAKNDGVSKSEIIRNLVKDSLVRTPQKRPEGIDYYNDSKGILRAVK